MPVLSPANQAILQTRLNQRQRREVHIEGMPRAAVLVPLLAMDAGFEVLFAKRAQSVPTHSGQVAFPGGHVEQTDADIVATALRESNEEVGLSSSDAEVLGLLDDVVAISNVLVTPVLAVIAKTFQPQVDQQEIDYTFTVPLQHLALPSSITNSYRRKTPLGELEFPVYSGGPDPIWGLTAWIVTELLPLVKAP